MPVGGGQESGTHGLRVDLRLGAQHALDELLRRHLEAQHEHGAAERDAHVLGDVEREGRLSHAWASGDDDEIRRLEARRLEIELLEAGGDAGDVLLPLVEPLDVLERVLEDFADGQRAALQPPLGETEDTLLGVVDERLHLVLGVEGLRDDLRRRLDELAEDRHVAHDRRVGAEVGGDRRLFHEEGDGGRTADELDLVGAAQLLAERERVDGRAAIEQREHRLVERAMRLRVEVRGAEHLDHARQRLAAFEQDGAERGALGIEVVRWNPGREFQWAHDDASPSPSNMRPDLERGARMKAKEIVPSGHECAQPVDRRGYAIGIGGQHVDKQASPRTGRRSGAGARRASRDAEATGGPYSRTTLTRSCAVTSPCSRTGTLVSPSVLIASPSCTRRRSTLTPWLSRKSTRSCDVTEPNSLPSSDACRRSS